MKLAIVLLAVISGTGAPPADLDDIHEATFRYMFTKNASGLQQKAGVYCLSIDGKDPTDAFMKRFDSHRPPVKRVTECEVTDLSGVQDRQTGQRGLIFRIQKVQLTGASGAAVEGGYYEGNMSASGNTYLLEKKQGVWKVVSDAMHWIS